MISPATLLIPLFLAAAPEGVVTEKVVARSADDAIIVRHLVLRGSDTEIGMALVLKLYLLACLVRWTRDRRLQRYFDFAAL